MSLKNPRSNKLFDNNEMSWCTRPWRKGRFQVSRGYSDETWGILYWKAKISKNRGTAKAHNAPIIPVA